MCTSKKSRICNFKEYPFLNFETGSVVWLFPEDGRSDRDCIARVCGKQRWWRLWLDDGLWSAQSSRTVPLCGQRRPNPTAGDCWGCCWRLKVTWLKHWRCFLSKGSIGQFLFLLGFHHQNHGKSIALIGCPHRNKQWPRHQIKTSRFVAAVGTGRPVAPVKKRFAFRHLWNWRLNDPFCSLHRLVYWETCSESDLWSQKNNRLQNGVCH